MMNDRLSIDFYETNTGSKPVHEWLKAFPKEDRKIIGDDIRHVQEEWPVGMPICKNMGRIKGCWEMRTRTRRLKSIRIFFTIENGQAVLLHGFAKKDNQTASGDVCTVQERLKHHRMKRR
jgi:phage-related protein